MKFDGQEGGVVLVEFDLGEMWEFTLLCGPCVNLGCECVDLCHYIDNITNQPLSVALEKYVVISSGYK